MRRNAFQGGAAIVMAMLVAALSAAVAVALLARMDRWVQHTVVGRDSAQARELAVAATAYARTVLAEDARQSNVDHEGEEWARRLPAFSAEGGEIEGYIEDMQGRWNLNDLWDGKAIDPVALKVYRRLLDILGLNAALADSLADWMLRERQATTGQAAGGRVPTMPGQGTDFLLDHIQSLKRIPGYDDGVIGRLAAFVSVLPTRREVNINTAPPEVLAAIQPGLSLADARQLVASRRNAWFRDGIDFRRRMPEHLDSNDTPVAAASQFFLIHISARYGTATMRLLSLVRREMGQEFPKVIWQSEQ